MTFNNLLFDLILLLILIDLQSLVLVNGNNMSNNKHDHLKHVSICEEDKLYSWCIPSNYDENVEPWKYRDKTNSTLPWIYNFRFDILDVKQINDQTQTVTLMMYFRIKWLEPRIKINNSNAEWIQNLGGLSYSPQLLKHMWYPDLEIYGVENFRPKSILKDLAELNIYRDKFIQYNTRVDTSISCQMNFDHYPMDSHACPFQISSYRGTIETISCSSNYFYNETNQRNLQYSIRMAPLPPQSQTFSIRSGFVYKTCGFNIILSRGRSQIFFQVYLTSAMFVIVSWLSFIIKPEVVPGRIALLVTTFLVLVNVFNSAKSQAPVSEHLNAIDVYLVGCIAHVFLALMEYAIVLFRGTTTTFSNAKCHVKPNDSNSSMGIVVKSRHREPQDRHVGQYRCCKYTLDKLSLVLFPVSFASFIFVYVALYAL